jgi:Na+-translocating ferredoxin:NAD+ oxidoreductase RNF subunit RnfB
MSIAILTLAALCFVFATLLVIAHRVLHVDEDPRIEGAQEMLPGTNCGACGFPGCLGLAQAMVGGTALPGKCTVMTEDEREELATGLRGRLQYGPQPSAIRGPALLPRRRTGRRRRQGLLLGLPGPGRLRGGL